MGSRETTTPDPRPSCDFCPTPATHDGKTLQGPWAYMCRAHFERLGVGLGTGRGQRFVDERGR